MTAVQTQNEDSPVDAQASEEKQAKDDKGTEDAPSQTSDSEAESKPDQKETSSQKEGGDSPSDLGEARQTSKVRKLVGSP